MTPKTSRGIELALPDLPEVPISLGPGPGGPSQWQSWLWKSSSGPRNGQLAGGCHAGMYDGALLCAEGRGVSNDGQLHMLLDSRIEAISEESSIIESSQVLVLLPA